VDPSDSRVTEETAEGFVRTLTRKIPQIWKQTHKKSINIRSWYSIQRPLECRTLRVELVESIRLCLETVRYSDYPFSEWGKEVGQRGFNNANVRHHSCLKAAKCWMETTGCVINKSTYQHYGSAESSKNSEILYENDRMCNM